MNWKGYERKGRAYSGYYTGIWAGKPRKTTKTSVRRTAGVPVEIQTKKLKNKSPVRYRYTMLLGVTSQKMFTAHYTSNSEGRQHNK
jgi:hypothetical protein